MVRPLNGMREVFRRLEEREEGRTRRQYEREELMGAEHNDNIDNYRDYWHRWQPEETNFWQRQMQQRLYNSFYVPARSGRVGDNIRGVSANHMWVDWDFESSLITHDSYFGVSRGRANTQEYADVIVQANGQDHTVQIPIPSTEWLRPNEFLRAYRGDYDYIPWDRRRIFFGINDFFVGRASSIYYHPSLHRVTNRAIVYKEEEQETVVFGTKESFVRQLMEDKLYEFFGLNKKEIKVKRMMEARASKKSFVKLLLRKEKY